MAISLTKGSLQPSNGKKGSESFLSQPVEKLWKTAMARPSHDGMPNHI
ncbi:hypothetical protein L1047_12205 [Synechococcus sp. Nb3U1]|nr:hypothetical protein [Synechococcus sp. Nb3U1]MCF2971958.1 hypothetical protein [Synechococcus sp. Nb3U1]